MNRENKEFRFLIIIALLCAFWIGFLSSCSANYHMAKFIKKGGKIKNDTTLVTFNDTIRINGKDSIIVRTVQAVCPEMKSPKTRYETRIEYRYKTKVEKAQVKWRTKYQTKYIKQQKKIETKNNKTLNLLLIVIGLITLTILAFKFSK
jgi:beta-xylosidase